MKIFIYQMLELATHYIGYEKNIFSSDAELAILVLAVQNALLFTKPLN
jgi:hypothetical protein